VEALSYIASSKTVDLCVSHHPVLFAISHPLTLVKKIADPTINSPDTTTYFNIILIPLPHPPPAPAVLAIMDFPTPLRLPIISNPVSILLPIMKKMKV